MGSFADIPLLLVVLCVVRCGGWLPREFAGPAKFRTGTGPAAVKSKGGGNGAIIGSKVVDERDVVAKLDAD